MPMEASSQQHKSARFGHGDGGANLRTADGQRIGHDGGGVERSARRHIDSWNWAC